MKKTMKRLYAILLTAALLLSLFASGTAVFATEITNWLFNADSGDVNNDGAISQQDAELLNAILSGTTAAVDRADVDANNIIEQYDLTALQSIINNTSVDDGDMLVDVTGANLQSLYVKGDSKLAVYYEAKAADEKKLTIRFEESKDWTAYNTLAFDILGLTIDESNNGYTIKLLGDSDSVSSECSYTVSKGWNKQSIALSNFNNLDFSAISGIEFSFLAQSDISICIDNLIPTSIDFTSVLGKTDTVGEYLLDASNKYYNFIATSGNEWSTRLEFANATQAAQMGEKYTHVEFVVQLPAEYAAKLQVFVNSKYCYLNNENIKVYDAATEEEISVGSDGAVPTGKWLRIVADIEGILGAPITAQSCWRIALTHKGNNTTTVTKVARVLAVDPLNYEYEAPEAINYVLPDYLDFTSVVGKTDTAGQYLLDASNKYYNFIATSGNEWSTRLEFVNAVQAAQMGEKYTHVEFVVQLPEEYAAKLQVYVNSQYCYLNNENIKVYDAATEEEISVGSDGAVPTGKWLRIVADIKGILGAPITAQSCWRVALTHNGNNTTTITKVARVLAVDPLNYEYEAPEAINYTLPDYLDFTSVVCKTDTGSQYLLDAANEYYNYIATSDNEWLNRVEFVNAVQAAQMGEKYTHVEFVVQLPEEYAARLQVYVNSQYCYLNNENIKVYDAATEEEISVGSDGAVPTGKWLRIVADIKGILGTPITAQSCWRVALTHKGNSTTTVTKVARVLAVDPLNYEYEAPESINSVLPDYLDFTSVLGSTGAASQYLLDASNEYYNYFATSGGEWDTRLDFANATQAALMGEKYTHVEFVVKLPEQYAARLQVYVSSQYCYLNNENIKVYDAATGEEISVESDGAVPTGKWLRIVADIEGILGAPITAQNCWRVALTHKGNSTTTVTKVARVLAVDPLNYEYEAPEAIYVLSDYIDFTSVLSKTDTGSQYLLDASNEYYNYTATSNNEWLNRLEFANATQTALMGEKYSHVEFVVQLPEQYAARLQVYVNSQYCYLNNENIKVYDAATGGEISVGSDGAVPTGKWLRIVADVEGILGAPVTAQSCWRVALTHKGNSTTTVTKVARVLAVDPLNYVYVAPEAVK